MTSNEHTPLYASVTAVQFSILSPEQIRAMSVVEVTKSDGYQGNEPIPGGLFDPRMGVIEHGRTCPTCHQRNTHCPGHPGRIELARPVYHGHFFEIVRKTLRCVCFRCSALLLDPEQEPLKGILARKITRQKRFELVYACCSKVRSCDPTRGCGARQPTRVIKEGILRLAMEWREDNVDGGEDDGGVDGDGVDGVDGVDGGGEDGSTVDGGEDGSGSGGVSAAASSSAVRGGRRGGNASATATKKASGGKKASTGAGASSATQQSQRSTIVFAEDALRILRRVTDADAEAMGFDRRYCRPEWLIATVLLVPPPAVRPSVRSDTGQRTEDDLTSKLLDIVKANQKLRARLERGASFDQCVEFVAYLQYHVATFVDNRVPGLSPTHQFRANRVTRSLVERLRSKEGRIRGNLMGKRVEFSARSVLSPDPNISVDEVGVPIKIAMNLTFPEVVTPHNIERLTQAVRNGADVYPGARFIKRSGEPKKSLKSFADRSAIALSVGDVVERHMIDGDVVLFNRQPSLHRMSMMAHRVRVMPYFTFRSNLCVCSAYNSDMDGDELNLHLPQSVMSANELAMLASVMSQVISPRDGAPIISIVQDLPLGVYRITMDGVRVPRKIMCNILSSNPRFNGAMEDFVPMSEADDNGDDTCSGRDALSTVMPPSVNVVTKNVHDQPVAIRGGRILSGPLNKNTYQDATVGLVHSIYNELGPEETRVFLDNTMRLVCSWLMTSGFSVGVADLLVHPETEERQRKVVADMKAKAAQILAQVHAQTIDYHTIKTPQEYVEDTINGILNAANTEVGKIGLGDINQYSNRICNMIHAGSKGKSINLGQMVSCVGQQNVEGKRIAYGFDGRTLPHFSKFDDSPESRGFVESSFVRGLTPAEFFFHSMGGREGLIDTAVKTSDVGYIQRKLVKAMEDSKVSHDASVRNASGAIVQFLYGEDGMDATKVERQRVLTIGMDPILLRATYLLQPSDFDGDDASAASRALGLSESQCKQLRDARDQWADVFRAHYDRIVHEREVLIECVFGGVEESRVSYPVALERIIESAVARGRLLSVAATSTAEVASPDNMLTKLNALRTELVAGPRLPELRISSVSTRSRDGRVGDGSDLPGGLFGVLLDTYLSPKRLLLRYRADMTVQVFDDIVETVRHRFYASLAHAGEMVGVVAAQSIGEPATQMTLNSVEWSTELMMDFDGTIRRVKIGEWIDALMESGAKDDAAIDKEQIEEHPNDTLLGWIKERNVHVLSCDTSGKVDWQLVEAVTRHPVVNRDGTNTLIRVTLESGRSVTATKAKSFLKRVNNAIVGVDGEDLRVGDYLPVSTIFPVIDGHEIDTWRLDKYIPKSEYVYMSEVHKALEAIRSGNRFWYRDNHGQTFTLPYSRSDSIIATFVGVGDNKGNGRRQSCIMRDGCVYPKNFVIQPAHIPEAIPLDEDFGFFVGAYLAEGCCTEHHLLIANVDDAFNDRIIRFWEKYDIRHHVDQKYINNGFSKTIRSHCMVLTQLFLRAIGTGSGVKRFPAELFAAPPEFLKGVVDGYFSGDGSVNGRRITAGSICLGLLEDIQQILTKFDIRCKIVTQHNALRYNLDRGFNAKLGYEMSMDVENTLKFKRTFKLTLAKKQERLDAIQDNVYKSKTDVIPNVITQQFGDITIPRYKLDEFMFKCKTKEDRKVFYDIDDEDIFYDRIVRIEEVENKKPWAYDLTVENTRTFSLGNGLFNFDTFHASGTASASAVVVSGVPRIKELISVSKRIKAPAMTLVVGDETARTDKDACMKVVRAVEMTRIGDVVSRSRVYFDPTDFESDIADDASFVASYRDFIAKSDIMSGGGDGAVPNDMYPWLLRMEFDREKMLEHGLTMMGVYDAIASFHEGRVSMMFSDDNAADMIMRVRLLPDESDHSRLMSASRADDAVMNLKALERSIMDIIVKGIRRINKAILDKVKTRRFDPITGTFKEVVEWVIMTDGTNMSDCLAAGYLDAAHCMSNDIQEVYAVLGVEAARQALCNELMKVMKEASVSVNFRHISLLVDTMTHRGYLLSIDRHGINKIDVGPLAKASFEETTDMLIKAGIFSEVDHMRGVAGNIMLGQVPQCGTGDSDVLVDMDMLMSIAPPADDDGAADDGGVDGEAGMGMGANIESLDIAFDLPDIDSSIVPIEASRPRGVAMVEVV